MAKGFNLILIERDGDSNQNLEDQLRKLMPEKNTIFVKIVLNKFDQDSINWAVSKYSTYPVKIFVNCKSSKKLNVKKVETDPATLEERKKKLLKDSLITNPNDPLVNEILSNEDDITNFEVSTSAEIHYTGKENITGYAALVNNFLRSMLMTSKNPCLINVDNVDGAFRHRKMEDGQVFYEATLAFKDKFTSLMQQKGKTLKTITVKTNYQTMPDGVSTKAANKLCAKTFAYVGLKKEIYV
jgi:hypothetical protein